MLARGQGADHQDPARPSPPPAGYGNWYDAPLPLVQGGSATYFGASVPFDLGTLAAIEFAAMAGAESFRGQAEAEKRVYPGGAFDPMGMVSPACCCTWAAARLGRCCVVCPGHQGEPWHAHMQLDFALPSCPGRPWLQSKGNLDELKTKEIKNGRLAMVACLGFAAQHAATGASPLAALGAHLANPFTANFATNVSGQYGASSPALLR